jgi:hypothetical protein
MLLSMADEQTRVEGNWMSGAARVMSMWLLIAATVWVAWMVLSPADTRPRLFVLLMLAVMSALLAPIYGGIAYVVSKRRQRPRSASGALWTSILLFVPGVGLTGYGYLVLQAVGRGVR